MDALAKRMRKEGREAAGLACGELCIEGAARIEWLEAALKEVADLGDGPWVRMARAALAGKEPQS